MIDAKLARLRTHRNNIHWYGRLLNTQLSELERSFVLKRLDEERSALQELSSDTFPFVLTMPRAVAAP